MKTKLYQWWKDHRKLVTLILYLSVFAVYIRTPFQRESEVRDTCAKLNSSYQITGDEAIKKIDLVRPAIKKYLFRYVRSNFLRVDVDEMAIAIYLPVARFRKASIQKVFADSRRKI